MDKRRGIQKQGRNEQCRRALPQMWLARTDTHTHTDSFYLKMALGALLSRTKSSAAARGRWIGPKRINGNEKEKKKNAKNWVVSGFSTLSPGWYISKSKTRAVMGRDLPSAIWSRWLSGARIEVSASAERGELGGNLFACGELPKEVIWIWMCRFWFRFCFMYGECWDGKLL